MAKLNTFISMNHKWMISHIISDYMQSKIMFSQWWSHAFQSGGSITFQNLKTLSDLLYEIKEDQKLIYKRLIDPQAMCFEESDKITPNRSEIDFMNNVGLLFHKTLVARELKYVTDHYTIDSTDYVNSNISLGSYFEKIQAFFIAGSQIIKQLLMDYIDNEPLLYYLLENESHVQECLDEKVIDLLIAVFGQENLAKPYTLVGQYCLDSGWYDRAKRYLTEAHRLDANEQVKNLLSRLRVESLS